MTIRHLKIYLAVCQMESITKAADYLNMAQPAVSRVIRELEEYYKVDLFERMNRKMYITPAGKMLFSYVSSVMDQLEEAKTVIRDQGNMTKIRVGINESYGRSVLAGWIGDFCGQKPVVPVHIKINNSRIIEEELLHNDLDFGIMDYPENASYFHTKLLLNERMTVVCAPGYAIPEEVEISELGKHPLLVRETGSGTRNYMERLFGKDHIKPNIQMESISTQSLIEVCKTGLGILFVPRMSVCSCLEKGTLKEVRVAGGIESRKYYFVYHKSKFFTRSMMEFEYYLFHSYRKTRDNRFV